MADTADPTPPAQSAAASTGDDSTRRTTKPGTKRLFLTLSVLLSFLAGLPFLLKSTEIHRSPLPTLSITSLSNHLQSNPPSFPCHFQVIIFPHSQQSDPSLADELSLSISHQLESYTTTPSCTSCNPNSISVTIDSGSNCITSRNSISKACLWTCGAARLAETSDDVAADDLFLSSLDKGRESECGRAVYTVFVIEGEERERVVVGKYRHAWILVQRVDERQLVLKVGEIFGEYFGNRGEYFGNGGVGNGEIVPVGSDGNVVLSFSLLNADPNDWVYDWEFQKMGEEVLEPVVEALKPVANITIESQVLYHTPKSSISYWDDELAGYVLNTGDLPFFVNSNEWHLDTSLSASGRSKILQFVVYVPSASECPLYLRLPDGQLSNTNAFISPMWGGVVVWNPPTCYLESQNKNLVRDTVPPQELKKILEIFIGQLRLLFGLKSNNFENNEKNGISKFMISEEGFAKWELDALYRYHTCFNLLSCVTTLESLSRLVESLPRMIVMDEIGKQVELSLEAADLAQRNISLGVNNASSFSSVRARALAENAFFHPSIMSISYSSIEHYFAIYMPFFAPVSLHVLLAAIKEIKRYKVERAKYLAFLSNQAGSS